MKAVHPDCGGVEKIGLVSVRVRHIQRVKEGLRRCGPSRQILALGVGQRGRWRGENTDKKGRG